MNQILTKIHKVSNSNKNFHSELSNELVNFSHSQSLNLKKKNFLSYIRKNQYRLQFFVSIIVAIIFFIIFCYHIQKSNEQEKLSKELLNNYTLTLLYENRNNNLPVAQAQSVIIENPFVIGMIRIPQINLNYPILSETNNELLKISLCRFAGPMPNEFGNLCIAGHNYVGNKFFGRLSELKKNDLIEIYDLSGNKIIYSVFDKYDVNDNDLSCTNQDVGTSKIITLLTCNNINGRRTVVKAKQKI